MLNSKSQQTPGVPTLDPAPPIDPARQRAQTTGGVPTVLGVPISFSLSEKNGGERVTPSLLAHVGGLGHTRHPGTPAHADLPGVRR